MQKFASGIVAATRCNAQQHAATHCVLCADYGNMEQLEERVHRRERAREREQSREKDRESRRRESEKDSEQVQESMCVYVRV